MHPGLLTLAVDNDEAGRDFCQKLSEKGLPIETDLVFINLEGFEEFLRWKQRAVK